MNSGRSNDWSTSGTVVSSLGSFHKTLRSSSRLEVENWCTLIIYAPTNLKSGRGKWSISDEMDAMVNSLTTWWAKTRTTAAVTDVDTRHSIALHNTESFTAGNQGSLQGLSVKKKELSEDWHEQRRVVIRTAVRYGSMTDNVEQFILLVRELLSRFHHVSSSTRRSNLNRNLNQTTPTSL
jgi:hypothetical protein